MTGCGNHNNSENDGKNTIRIFTYSGQEFESVTMDSVMKKIEDTVGVKLSFEGAVADDYYTKLTYSGQEFESIVTDSNSCPD